MPVVTCVISGTLGKSLLRAWAHHQQNTSSDSLPTNGAPISAADTLLSQAQAHGTPAGGGGSAGSSDLSLAGESTPPAVEMKLLLALCFSRVVLVGGVQFMGIAMLLPMMHEGTPPCRWQHY